MSDDKQIVVTEHDRYILRSILNWIRNFRVTGIGVSFHNTDQGAQVDIRPPILGGGIERPNTLVSPVQFGSSYSVQGWYNGLIVLGSATTIANGTIPAGALPTSPPSGGGFYTGGTCLVINQQDRFLSGVWPIPANQIVWNAIKVGTTGPSDSPANTPIYACQAIKGFNCLSP